MSILRDAHGVVINGGDFRNVQNNVAYQYGPTGIDVLREASTPEAAVDAEERSYAPSCYPGTRDQYIEDITNWASAGGCNGAQPIYWMKGPAGVGKSAIAQTCAAKLKEAGQLGAAFFFSINGRRKDHTRFFPTLAYQLSTIYDDYREIVNRKVSADHTLVKKTITSQFRSLIVEPLLELEEQGKELRTRAILVDGLDECQSQDAQVEIIKIIASSARDGSSPFCWAVFSREEAHITSTFVNPDIASRCYSVFLPISRKADGEITLYLRGGFRNILQRRNLLSLASSWPTEDDIRTLVDAAAGLFAHPATVLRFVDRHSYSGFQESLEAVIASIARPSTKTTPLYTELDNIYTLILQRAPADIVPTTLLLLSHMVSHEFDCQKGWFVTPVCNTLGISETVFLSIYHHLQAVVTVQSPPHFTIDKAAALERPYYDQDPTFKPSSSLEEQLRAVHGTINFHHKSFYDFLADPNRSSTFSVTAPSVHKKLFDCYVQQHAHYGASYAIQGSKLVLVPGVTGSSVPLSWPQGTEFVDSFLMLWSFSDLSLRLSHDGLDLGQFLRHVPSSSLQKLTELDYRKCLIADEMIYGLGLWKNVDVAGCVEAGMERYTGNSVFTCIDEDKYDDFNPESFLTMVKKLEELRVIRPCDSYLGNSRVASLLRTLFRQEPYGKRCGRYRLGHGDKSVIWYWEFDTEERYFHEIRTVNFAQAMAHYRVEKFKIWESTDQDYFTDSSGEEGDEANDEDGVPGSNEEDDDTNDGESNVLSQSHE